MVLYLIPSHIIGGIGTSKIQKLIDKFYKQPIPNNITFHEVQTLFEHFGCKVIGGGNHMKVVCVEFSKVIAVPRHGNCVQEVYIKQLKMLLDDLKGGN